jgi:hypothetical protein
LDRQEKFSVEYPVKALKMSGIKSGILFFTTRLNTGHKFGKTGKLMERIRTVKEERNRVSVV